MQTIFTIGYEGTDIEHFVKTLVHAGVKVLADVRAVTVSRKKGFSKNSLRQHLEEAGIRYVHLGGLGDPKLGREAARAGRYEDFRAIYGQHLVTPAAQKALTDLAQIIGSYPTCLMCFERDPKTCHRSIVAHVISVDCYTVSNLYGDQSRHPDHAAKRASRGSGQSSSAAQQDLW